LTRSTDEAAAWALVRAVLRQNREGTSTVPLQDPVRAGSCSGSGIVVDENGGWVSATPLSPAAQDLLDLFLPLCRSGEFVMAQAGQSLDGRIATEAGHSHFVTGPEDILRLHRLRALVDAVVVGVGTVVSDDPRLTVREAEGENPVRVVLDPRGRIPPDAVVLRNGAAPTLLVGGEGGGIPPGAGPHVRYVALPFLPDQGFDPVHILAMLRQRGIDRVLVEGGGVTVSRFLQSGVLHRLHVTVAPLLIGSGRPAFTLAPVATLDEAIRPRCRHFHLGNDLLFDLDFG